MKVGDRVELVEPIWDDQLNGYLSVGKKGRIMEWSPDWRGEPGWYVMFDDGWAYDAYPIEMEVIGG